MSVRAGLVDGVWEVVLDRPDQRNAMTPQMLEGVGSAIEGAAGHAIVLRGEGRTFCAGFDLRMCVEVEGTLEALLRGLAGVIVAMRESPLGVVVAAQGAAIAGGCALLGGADVVVGEVGARYGYPVTRLGISPGVSAPTLSGLVGAGRTRERMLDPGLIDGAAALQIGLVHELAPDAEGVLARSRAIAGVLAAKPREAFRATKAWLDELERRMSGVAEARGAGLATSIGLVGSAEQRRMTDAAWAAMRGRG
jgi:enoyl-CoA hydratase/carnithine racemase